MNFNRFLRPALPLLAVCIALPASLLLAADPKKDEKKEEAPAAGGTTLSQFKLGEVIANGPLTEESVTGKAVVIEIWGIH